MTQEISAGGVVYKKQNDQVFWLICKHSGYHKWVFPKGRVEKGEDLQTTAVREVEEETGIVAKIVCEVGNPEKYIYTLRGEKIDKSVHYYLMEYVSGKIDDHDWEMEEVEWVSYEIAMERLGFEGAKRVLEKARELVK